MATGVYFERGIKIMLSKHKAHLQTYIDNLEEKPGGRTKYYDEMKLPKITPSQDNTKVTINSFTGPPEEGITLAKGEHKRIGKSEYRRYLITSSVWRKI